MQQNKAGLIFACLFCSTNLYSISTRATREADPNEIGLHTSNGYTITGNDWYGVLPHPSARASTFNPSNPYASWNSRVKIEKLSGSLRAIIVPIYDVGPGNQNDDYWQLEPQRQIYSVLTNYWATHSAPRNPELIPNWSTMTFTVPPSLSNLGQGLAETVAAWRTSIPVLSTNSYNYGCDQFGRHRYLPVSAGVLNGTGIGIANLAYNVGLMLPSAGVPTSSADNVNWEFTDDLPKVNRIILSQGSTIVLDSGLSINHPAQVGPISCTIIFSESMKKQNLPIVSFGLSQPFSAFYFSNGSWSQTNYGDDTWTGSTQITTANQNGLNTIKIQAQDLGNNKIDRDHNPNNGFQPGDDISYQFSIVICDPAGPDMTPPQITVDPSALQCINQPGSFDLAGIVSDNCSDPQLRLDGGSPEQLTPTSNPHEFSFHISVDLDEGPNQFTLSAIDASSQTLQFPVTLNFDTTPPFIQTFLPSPGALNVNPSAPIQAIFNEPLSSGEIVIEGTPVAGTSQLSGNVITFIHGPLPPDATFSARVRNAMDLCGNCPQ